jgi:hypothetical protein
LFEGGFEVFHDFLARTSRSVTSRLVIDIYGMTHYAKPAARKVVKKSAKAKKGKKKKR